MTKTLLGLTQQQAAAKLLELGPNELVPEKKSTLIHKIWEVITEPMFLLLLAATSIYFILGDASEGIIMLGFISFIIIIDVVQEWKTDKTLETLRQMSSPQATVIRNGQEKVVPVREVVPDDVMLVEEGNKVAADGVMLTQSEILVDESVLTGESEPVVKGKGVKIMAGTVVVSGGAKVRVEQTGIKTQYGKIGAQVAAAPRQKTPLKKQIDQLIKISATVAIGLFLVVTMVTWFNLSELTTKSRIVESILAGITLAMAIIPEEFPVVLTVFLSMGAWRLAKKKTLIRRLPAIETLGAVKVLCTDKTGTLTENQMTVMAAMGRDELFKNSFDETNQKKLWSAMVLACELKTFEPMERAMLDFVGKKNKQLSKQLSEDKLLRDYPFTNAQKMMGHVWAVDEKKVMLAVKGAPENVLRLCSLSESEKQKIEKQQLVFAQKAYRVIAVAQAVKKEANFAEKLTDNTDLEFLGLVALLDPPRKGVARAVAQAKAAGVRVVMITGDNGVTAKAIAQLVGLPATRVITGAELEQMNEAEFVNQVQKVDIFARVVPEDKLKIIKALKKFGQITAMTGDGVNDAPALKYADIGIAMGQRGTQVAQEAADMVITDDNFTTIIHAIADGRRIYDNIKKSVVYIFVIHIPVMLAALVAPLMGIEPAMGMMLPLQVILLELVIDPTCSIVFERQVAEPDLMKRGPRDPKKFLLDKGQVVKILLQGLTIFLASFGVYWLSFQAGNKIEVARTLGITTLSLSSLFLVYVNSSETLFAYQVFLAKIKDKVVWAVNGGIILMLTAIIYTPLHQVFKLETLTLTQLLLVVGLAAASTLWWEVIKQIKLFGDFRR